MGENTPFQHLIVVLTFVVTLWSLARAKSTLIPVRKIPGVEAIFEALSRAAEQGRGVSFTTALTGLSPLLYACLGVLHAITRKVARLKLPLVVPQSQPDVLAATETVVRDAYRVEGAYARYDSRTLPYLSDEQFAFAAGYIGIVSRERPGACFLMGTFSAESLVLAQAGQDVGARQVAATIVPEQVAFFVVTCDYTLIGDELYAASAYLTEEPVQRGSLLAQDILKALFGALILYQVIVGSLVGAFPEIAAHLYSLKDFLDLRYSWW